MRSQPSAFAYDVLDALTAHIAVLDEHGVILGVNEAWRRFARENAGETLRFHVGRSYVEVCERAIRHDGDPQTAALLDGLRTVLDGRAPSFALEYPCHGPEEQRWFIVLATRCRYDGHPRVVIAHEDITARKKAEIALSEAEQTLRKILEALPVGVWLMDRSGTIVQGNRAGQQIWAGARYVPPEQFGEYKGWWLDSGRPIEAGEWAAARAIRDGSTSIDEEIAIECFDGSHKIILNSAVPLRDAAEAITGAIIVNQDVTARKRADDLLLRAKQEAEDANRELQQALAREQAAARTDELTGIYNRRHFFGLAQQQIDVAKRYRRPVSVILFDLDYFKAINDRHGHQFGDEVLRRVARAASDHLRVSDVFARYGGEEFIVLLPDSDAAQALNLSERIRSAVAAQPFEREGASVAATISAGVAALDGSDDSLERVILRADRALYAAKAQGRNRSMIYEPPPTA